MRFYGKYHFYGHKNQYNEYGINQKSNNIMLPAWGKWKKDLIELPQ